MPHPERMICWTLCAWFCSASARPAFGVDDFAFFHENVMGTSLELRVLADDRESARGAEDRVLGEIDRLALIFSEVKERAVSTSGSSQRGFRINGQWYSHILDPRSGLPADRIATGLAWSILIDASAIVLTLISLTGLVLLFYLKLRRIPGLAVAIIGTIIVLALFLLGVP